MGNKNLKSPLITPLNVAELYETGIATQKRNVVRKARYKFNLRS